ncbi:MAG TPA: universal stress protein [Streptosporangiaceae bacterium]|jgi:nucleotide-binding universal stress UspA family protein|nr:universal stress protein [Streptosporangiaceae bacterium]
MSRPGIPGVQAGEDVNVLVWVTENTWKACVDAARSLAPAGADFALLTVIDTNTAETAHGAFSGMLGRAGHDPAEQLAATAEAAACDLLDAAEARLGRPARRIQCRGQEKHEIVSAARDATMLIVARDGHGPGPKSLGKAVRFVVDHAPCPVLLVWPGPPGPIPAPPPPSTHPPHRPHHGRRHGPPG